MRICVIPIDPGLEHRRKVMYIVTSQVMDEKVTYSCVKSQQ